MEFRTLYADEIECRAAQVTEKGVVLLLYKDARVDQKLLDEVVGPMNWQRHHSRDNANCTVAIWDQTKGQWVEKEDTGKESNTEAEKGLASDSFKRACFNWGIGRELYTAPFVWIDKNNAEIKEAGTDAKGKKRYTTFDRFEVSSISYDKDRNISGLVIRNAKTKKVVYNFGSVAESSQEQPRVTENVSEAKAEPTPEQQAAAEAAAVGKQRIDAAKIAALATAAANHGVPLEKICGLYKVQSLAQLTEKQFSNINSNWENIKKA